MAIYRYVHVSFWEDTKVQDDMTPEDRYFMLYLLTNPHSSQTGVFEISKRQMSNEVGYTVETIEKLLDKFENELKIIKYDNKTKELIILNWYKYNWTSSIKVKKCIENEMKKIKSKDFLEYLNRVCIPYIYPMDTPTEQDGEKEKEKQKEKQEKNKNNIQKIIDFYNNNIGIITPYGLEVFQDYATEMSEDLVILAMKRAIEANKKTINYIKGILNNWSKKGIKTVLEVEEEDRKFKESRTVKEETEEEKNARKLRELEEALENDTK